MKNEIDNLRREIDVLRERIDELEKRNPWNLPVTQPVERPVPPPFPNHTGWPMEPWPVTIISKA